VYYVGGTVMHMSAGTWSKCITNQKINSVKSYSGSSKPQCTVLLNPLPKRKCLFIHRVSEYRAVNTQHLRYTKPICKCCIKQKSLFVLRSIHDTLMQRVHQTEFLNDKPGGA